MPMPLGRSPQISAITSQMLLSAARPALSARNAPLGAHIAWQGSATRVVDWGDRIPWHGRAAKPPTPDNAPRHLLATNPGRGRCPAMLACVHLTCHSLWPRSIAQSFTLFQTRSGHLFLFEQSIALTRGHLPRDSERFLREVALDLSSGEAGWQRQNEAVDAAIAEYRGLSPYATGDALAVSGEVNRMIAAAINANPRWFWQGPEG
jgi:hypothetical protein